MPGLTRIPLLLVAFDDAGVETISQLILSE
jgi:hypothetical protein